MQPALRRDHSPLRLPAETEPAELPGANPGDEISPLARADGYGEDPEAEPRDG